MRTSDWRSDVCASDLAEMWRIEIREDAKGRIRAKRDAYLTSDEGRAEAAARFEEQIIDLADLPDPEPLIEGFLYRDSLVRNFGPPKSLKSFVTLDMAPCLSPRLPLPAPQTAQAPVLKRTRAGEGKGV